MDVAKNVNVCPRCRNTMLLYIQSENHGKSVTITYTYQCIVCKYKLVSETVEIRRDTDRMYIVRKFTKQA